MYRMYLLLYLYPFSSSEVLDSFLYILWKLLHYIQTYTHPGPVIPTCLQNKLRKIFFKSSGFAWIRTRPMEYESCDYEWDDVLDDCCDFLNRPINKA